MAKIQRYISVKGGRQHNLKNISVDIPHNKFTVVTGVSGSGKSSLAFDTIYAEGQRRFVESLSAYARQFLERSSKPDADSITGLPPAIAIEQNPPSRNPRSTVGTATEIYDYIRLLYGRVGKTYCRECGKLVRKDSPESIVAEANKWSEGDKIYVLFPIVPKSKDIKDELANLKQAGFFRFVNKDDDEIIEYDKAKESNVLMDDLYVLVDRLALRDDEETLNRMTDSVETAFAAGEGKVELRNLTNGVKKVFSSNYECADCEIPYFEPEPRLFSFNNPYGACPHCQGFGRTMDIDEKLVIPDESRTLSRGAVHPFTMEGFAKHHRRMLRVARKKNISTDVPYRDLSDKEKQFVWEGADEYIGINGFFKILENKSYKLHYRVIHSRYRGYTQCKVCGGSRIRTSARQVYLDGKNVPELIDMPLPKLSRFINNLILTEKEKKLTRRVVEELKRRLGLLIDIGLEYLTLARLTHTLSGGESQRINLSTALGASLVGSLYVLDEPSIGMHPRDNKRMIDILLKLKNLGNTIIVVEHDLDIIRAADYVIDLGPAAGENGGEVIFAGDLGKITESDKSLTAKYLTEEKKIEVNGVKRKPKGFIKLKKPRKYNLKMGEVAFPTECLTVVTGVSGAGKSALTMSALYDYLKKFHSGYRGYVGAFQDIEGEYSVEGVELVDQSPIGKSSRSTPATYSKAFDAIREIFAGTQAAKQLGLKPGYFSFNVPGGRCDVCDGEGLITVDMQFLSDVHLECEACRGTRYKKEARNVLYKGKSIVDVLNMTISEAAEFFRDNNKVLRKLSALRKVGLGYLRLGQPSTRLSGGESQRVKLAAHLDSKSGKTLFIFDEPTTGLHLDDIKKLLRCFEELIDKGHSVIVIEHNLHVVASADWIIDIGPEAGDKGGDLVYSGPPEEAVKNEKSLTGKALKDFYEENA